MAERIGGMELDCDKQASHRNMCAHYVSIFGRIMSEQNALGFDNFLDEWVEIKLLSST